MNIAFVIGNGLTRKKIDPAFYEGKETYGCNLAYKDIPLKHLVCCDRHMVLTAVSELANKKCKVYTRQRWLNVMHLENVHALPDIPYRPMSKHDQPMNWGSGLYAALLACQSDCDIMVFLGFDLWPNTDNTNNNVYAGHNGYGPKNGDPVDPSGWIYQFTKLFEIYNDKQFVFVNKKQWRVPDQWAKYENFNTDTFASLNSL